MNAAGAALCLNCRTSANVQPQGPQIDHISHARPLLPALPQADEGSAEPAFVPLAIAPDAIARDATAFPEAAGLSLGVIAVEIGADIVLG